MDETKIERIKEATLKLIAQAGYSATSVEQIAKAAKVSAGYLYRHYPSKAKLAQAVYEERMKEFHDMILRELEERDKVKEVLSAIIDYLDALTKDRRDQFKFLFTLLHDHSFQFPKSRLEGVRKISRGIFQKGRKTGEIRSDYGPENVFYTFFSVPFKFFDSRMRKIFTDKKITPADIRNLKEICLNALR